jgi:hypothetical protein
VQDSVPTLDQECFLKISVSLRRSGHSNCQPVGIDLHWYRTERNFFFAKRNDEVSYDRPICDSSQSYDIYSRGVVLDRMTILLHFSSEASASIALLLSKSEGRSPKHLDTQSLLRT